MISTKRVCQIIALAYWLIAGCAPIVAAGLYFGWEIGVTDFAVTYGHLFLYPLVFGFMTALATAAATAELRKGVSWRVQKQVSAAIIALALLALGTEINGNTAFWEVPCPAPPHDSDWRQAYANYRDLKTASEPSDETQLAAWQQKQDEVFDYVSQATKRAPFGNPVRIAYLLSLFIQVVALATTLVAVAFEYKMQNQAGDYQHVDHATVLRRLDRSLAFGSIWFIMRVIFLETKTRLISASTRPGDYIALALFVCAVLLHLHSRYRHGDREPTNFALAIAGLGATLLGCFGLPALIGPIVLHDLDLLWWTIVCAIIWLLIWVIDAGDLGWSDQSRSAKDVGAA